MQTNFSECCYIICKYLGLCVELRLAERVLNLSSGLSKKTDHRVHCVYLLGWQSNSFVYSPNIHLLSITWQLSGLPHETTRGNSLVCSTYTSMKGTHPNTTNVVSISQRQGWWQTRAEFYETTMIGKWKRYLGGFDVLFGGMQDGGMHWFGKSHPHQSQGGRCYRCCVSRACSSVVRQLNSLR